MKEYGRRLLEKHGLNTNVTDELPEDYRDVELPLLALLILAVVGKRLWIDVELVLDNLPPRMAKYAVEKGEGISTSGTYVRLFPLHMAARAAPRLIIERMLLAAPNAARIKDDYECGCGDLALHSAIKEKNHDAIQLLVDSYPEAVLEKNDYGHTPLHYALMDAPRSIIECMLLAAPNAIRVKDSHGSLPLHHATKHKNSDAMELLVDAYPEAVLEKDSLGNTPLYFALMDAPRSIIEYMLLAAPNVIRMKDSHGNLPLHYAAQHKNFDAIELLVDAYPEAVLEENRRGQAPLHCVAENSQNKNCPKFSHNDIVKLLVRAYPKALFTTVKDDILNLDDIKLIVVEWSYQALERQLPLMLL